MNSGDISIIQLSPSDFIGQKFILICCTIFEISMQSLAQFLKIVSDFRTEDNFSFQERYKKTMLNNFKG